MDAKEYVQLNRVSRLRSLWLQREELTRVLSRAVEFALLSEGKNAGVSAFLDNVVARLLVRPDDLLAVCSLLEDKRVACEFMTFVVGHPLVDRDLVHAIVRSPDIFHALPNEQRWQEIAVLLYGSDYLNSHGSSKVEIEQFAPLGVNVQPSVVRSLVGSAFDEGILCDKDVARLLDLYPNDAYFRWKLESSSAPT